MKKRVRFVRDEKMKSGVHSDGGTSAYFVLLDGEKVGVVRKRSEYYSNIGHRGATYWYWDFYRLGDDGRALREPTGEYPRGGDAAFVGGGETRAQAVAEALVKLGHVDVAREVDADRADFSVRKLAQA